jgi:hypothetical protein
MMGSEEPSGSVEREIAEPRSGPPHVVLLGAGASKAACPEGDRHRRLVPVMNELAGALELPSDFPEHIRRALLKDFEAVYADLVDRHEAVVEELNAAIFSYFDELELSSEPTIYDLLLLCLRAKDVIFTFNWDPFLAQARRRLQLNGAEALPDMYFLHGNVSVGTCPDHQTIGYLTQSCRACGKALEPLRLLYPIREKAYQDGASIQGQWMTAQDALDHSFWFTIFGYSAPTTDIEAIRLLREAWHRRGERPFEQVEIISRPGSDHGALHDAWRFLIYRDHYEIHESFFDSWMARHPRRTLEAYWRQYIEGEWIDDNPVPRACPDVGSLLAWFRPLLDGERAAGISESGRVVVPLDDEEQERSPKE